MKKYFSHVIYLFIILFLIAFANIKAQEAEKNMVRALEERTKSLEYQEFAKRSEQIAEEAAARAIEQESLVVMAAREAEKAEEALRKCKSSKD